VWACDRNRSRVTRRRSEPYALPSASDLLRRLLSFTVAVIGILVVAPLIVLIAIAIKATSPGPVLLLRREATAAGLPRDFAIYDDDDQVAAVKLSMNSCRSMPKI